MDKPTHYAELAESEARTAKDVAVDNPEKALVHAVLANAYATLAEAAVADG